LIKITIPFSLLCNSRWSAYGKYDLHNSMREINSLKVQKIYEKVAIMVGGRSSIAIKDCGNPMTSKMVD
jgi:hypothetical protein